MNPTQTGALHDDIARRLVEAERRRAPIPPISEAHPGLDAEAAYRIQQATVAARLAAGDRIAGYKIGLTSAAMQELLGVREPDYAPILASTIAENGARLARDDFIQPKVEAEIAFVLGEELRGPGVTPEDVIAATEFVAPAIEVIDSRIVDWRIRLVDTIADMASSARVVLGEERTSPDAVDLAGVTVMLHRNGWPEAEGVGAAVLGHPAAAAAWAVNSLGALGATMEPGHVIMPGAMHAASNAAAGDEFAAVFGTLGTVRVGFT